MPRKRHIRQRSARARTKRARVKLRECIEIPRVKKKRESRRRGRSAERHQVIELQVRSAVA